MVWVEKKINNNHFVIKSDKPNVEISWQVTGVRQDPYANNHRVVAEVEKETENKGKYLHPTDFKQDEQKGIYYKKSQMPERRTIIR
jgi:hypothetical protein